MNKYKRLFGDSLIYMMGNFGSKLVSLIMVSFYTYTLSPSEYGNADVALTTISLVMPIVTCCIHEAILSFILKSEYEPIKILSNGIFVCLINSIIMSIVFICIYVLSGNHNLLWIAGIVIVEGFNSLLLQYSRATNHTKLYAMSGIVVTFSIAIFNIIFLSQIKLGLKGYFLSFVLAYTISIIVLFVKSGAVHNISKLYFEKTIIKEMLKFSIPLIPNSLLWWMMNALDKYVILFYLGEEYNGVYAVSAKIPTVLATFTTIFVQAWQVSAIIESDAEDKDSFYNRIFDGLLFFDVIAFLGIMAVIKPLLTGVIHNSYIDTWKYVPFLLLGTVFSSAASFLGANYLASKKTKGALTSSLSGGMFNLVLNFVLIKAIGLNGAAVATALSFLLVFILRIIDSRKFVDIKMNSLKICAYCISTLIELYVFYLCNEIITFWISFVLAIAMIFVNIDIIKKIHNSMKRRKNK